MPSSGTAVHMTIGLSAQIIATRNTDWPTKLIIRVYRDVILSAISPMTNLPNMPAIAYRLRTRDAIASVDPPSRRCGMICGIIAEYVNVPRVTATEIE